MAGAESRNWSSVLAIYIMLLRYFTATHVPGGENKTADAISRVQAVGSGGSLNPLSHSSASAGQLNTSALEQRCLHFLAQSLAPSTQKAHASGQRKFVEFCSQAGKLHPNDSPCPADEWTLCLFVSFLADLIQHLSIKNLHCWAAAVARAFASGPGV
ncbi:unnamed protein product [Porites lobata]|uniref:Uncharacterized protein n=1 Tax=Porites lobata TaxID=104759 RepID=A0ABN8NTX3_9CNID|nr:unnamed protein product [Porites lobata]